MRKPRWDAYNEPQVRRSKPRRPLAKSTRLPPRLDARVEYAGTLCLIRIRGKKMHAWVRRHVAGEPGHPLAPWQWLGRHAFICELRYAIRIAQAMQEEGFKVRVRRP